METVFTPETRHNPFTVTGRQTDGAGVGDDDIQREKLAVIGHMASSVAHDLCNPLASIVASAQAMLDSWSIDRAGERIGDVLREDLELILGEAKRASDIVTTMLAFARQHAPEWRVVALTDIVRQTVTLARHHLGHHGVWLHVEFDDLDVVNPPSWCWVEGDPNRLQQVLMNLIINAQQAIRSQRNNGNIWLRLQHNDDDGRVWLIVEDDGPGVPANLHKTIFKAFYTTKPNGEGTGLGLSIAAGIIAAHQGNLDVADREDGGARFSVILPVAGQPVVRKATSPPPEPARPSSRFSRSGRVLLVDDEAGIRRSVGRLLRRYGVEVETAATGSEALSALARDAFDLVISDIRMPGLSGEELYHLVVHAYPHMTSKIVFMSGDMMRHETQVFLKQSGCPSLQKPCELDDLMRVLEAYCPPRELESHPSSASAPT
jgi:nitrogen-specific signal transduction histidine kinase/CheY-like chemotaxis protein